MMTLSEVRAALSDAAAKQLLGLGSYHGDPWKRSVQISYIAERICNGKEGDLGVELWPVTEECLGQGVVDALIYYGFLKLPHVRDETGEL